MPCRPAVAILALLVLGPGAAARAQNTCGAFLALGYETPHPFAGVGDTLRVRMTLGTGSISGGTHLTVSRLRLDLDCDVSQPLGLGCTDDGAVIAYAGDDTILTDCVDAGGAPVGFTSGHPAGTTPNQVVLTPSAPVVIPRSSPAWCAVELDVVVAGRSTDPTPDRVEQVAGYAAASGDAVCDNGLASSASQSGSIALCPACTVGLCEAACDQQTGACLPVSRCEDGDACTVNGCDPDTGACLATAPRSCDDANSCTADTCDPASGCVHAPVDCDDGDACTTDACHPASGCAHVPDPCDDGNPCTADACDPATGCHHDAAALDGVSCDDGCPATSGERCRAGACTAAEPDRDGDGFPDRVEVLAGCSPDDGAEIPPQAPRAAVGGALVTYAAPATDTVDVASDPACRPSGTCGEHGLCTGGRVADPCGTDADCDPRARVCRIVATFAASPDLELLSATLDGEPLAGLPSVTPGCARKIDVPVPGARGTVVRLDVRGTLDGRSVRDVDRLVFR